jgi:hypothetical protein
MAWCMRLFAKWNLHHFFVCFVVVIGLSAE